MSSTPAWSAPCATRVVAAADGTPLHEEPLPSVALPADGAWTGEDAGAAAAAEGRPATAHLEYRVSVLAGDAGSWDLGTLAGPELPAPLVILTLAPPAPNPAGAASTIRFRAPAGAAFECALYDLRGQRLAVLRQATGTGDWQEIAWNGRAAGSRLAAGVYLIRLRVDERSIVRRIVLTP